MSVRKYRYPAWLHADMETLQNRIFNYVFHRGVNPVDRHEIQAKWDKIKSEMDTALNHMDLHAYECSSVKANDKVAVSTPKAH